jgi:ribosomal protein S15P/S13E
VGCSCSSASVAGLLNYMQRSNLEGYRELIKELGLRR